VAEIYFQIHRDINHCARLLSRKWIRVVAPGFALLLALATPVQSAVVFA
jgi:hypothetical protein